MTNDERALLVAVAQMDDVMASVYCNPPSMERTELVRRTQSSLVRALGRFKDEAWRRWAGREWIGEERPLRG